MLETNHGFYNNLNTTLKKKNLLNILICIVLRHLFWVALSSQFTQSWNNYPQSLDEIIHFKA